MEYELLKEVREGLQKHKGRWPQIAKEVPEASYTLIAEVGRGTYKSEVQYSRLSAIKRWLDANEAVKA